MNTVIVDHKGFRVGCNALGNVIITMPFHIHSLEKLGDDGNYLKASLWPLLEGLHQLQVCLIFVNIICPAFLNRE
jgi:hypothetical protein